MNGEGRPTKTALREVDAPQLRRTDRSQAPFGRVRRPRVSDSFDAPKREDREIDEREFGEIRARFRDHARRDLRPPKARKVM
jgi:hypothetical protein